MTNSKNNLGECPTDDEILMNFDIPGQRPEIQNHIKQCANCAERTRGLIKELGRHPTDDEIRENFDIPGRKKVIEMHLKKCEPCVQRARKVVSDLLSKRMRVVEDFFSNMTFERVGIRGPKPTDIQIDLVDLEKIIDLEKIMDK